MGYSKTASRILNLAIAVTAVLGTGVVFAQTQPPNPLEVTAPDPLLPPRERPLTPLERRRVGEAIADLQTQADAQAKAGNYDGAFALWYHQLRLQRVLGPLEEVQALARVGGIAWGKNRKADVQIITQRLATLQQQQAQKQKGNLEPALLSAFAQAYEQVRDIDRTLAIYQQILANARKQQDRWKTHWMLLGRVTGS